MATEASGLQEARDAKERAKKLFAKQADVVGVGITRIGTRYGVKVDLGQTPNPSAELPETIDGVPIRIEVVGPVRKR